MVNVQSLYTVYELARSALHALPVRLVICARHRMGEGIPKG